MRGLRFILAIVLVLFTAPAAAQQPSIPWPTAGWQTASPESQGMDSAALTAVLDTIIQQRIDIHSLLVVRNGYLVLEAYRHPYTADMLHWLNSATKSVVSALVGIALDQGYIESLDQPMLDFFADRAVDNLDASKRSITVENLLTMSSGLTWANDALDRSTLNTMYGTDDWVQFIVDQPMEDEPGKNYLYNSGGSHLLAVIVEQATGQSLLDFARPNLFEPLGIESLNWQTDPQGHYFGGRGLDLTPRDMAKFGYLFLKGGEWDGQQLIPADFVAASMRQHIGARPTAEGYGYQWWVDFRGYAMAAGAGGQYIIVDPAHDLVVVLTSALNDVESIRQRTAIYQNGIVAAVQADEPLPENPAGAAALSAAVDALAHPAPALVPPLPQTASGISGRTYVFKPNDFNWESFVFQFTDDPASAYLSMDGQIPVEIGLDTLFRVTPLPDAGAIFAKGSWTKDNRFVVQYEVAGASYRNQLTFTFEDQLVNMLFRDGLTGTIYRFEGSAA